MTICGLDCCGTCSLFEQCGGCNQCNGHPLGGHCIAATCISHGGKSLFETLQKMLVEEFNGLNIPELRIDHLNLLHGFYVNLEYPLPSGHQTKILDDRNVYLGNQIERRDGERCYGIVTDGTFLLVASYGCQGNDPELILFKQIDVRKKLGL